MGPSKYFVYHNQIDRQDLLTGLIRTEEVLDQFLPKGSKSEGQGRKRLRSETKDSQGESRGQRRKQRVRSDTKDNEELTVHEENEDGGSMDNEA